MSHKTPSTWAIKAFAAKLLEISFATSNGAVFHFWPSFTVPSGKVILKKESNIGFGFDKSKHSQDISTYCNYKLTWLDEREENNDRRAAVLVLTEKVECVWEWWYWGRPRLWGVSTPWEQFECCGVGCAGGGGKLKRGSDWRMKMFYGGYEREWEDSPSRF